MENILKNIKNVNHYRKVSQELHSKYQNISISINATTALVIKHLRPYEVQYFKTSREMGAAWFFLEKLLVLPPSKAWSLIGEDIVCTMQTWIKEVKNILMTDKDLWLKFLRQILNFIKELCDKDPCLADLLVKFTAGLLFELATEEALGPLWRHELLYCINVYCSRSTRSVRFKLRKRFKRHFVDVSLQELCSVMLARAACAGGYAPEAVCALEAMLRWLVPREQAYRARAAELWFPAQLCPPHARSYFVHATWDKFFSDARTFLNMVNEDTALVTSVRCKKLVIGGMVIISGAENLISWLDINTSVPSLSVMIDPRALPSEHRYRSTETVVLREESARTLRLHIVNMELTLSVAMLAPARVQPCGLPLPGDVCVVLSGAAHLARLDAALRALFRDKYQINFDVNGGLPLLPSQENTRNQSSGEESRFSHTEVARRPRISGVGIARKPQLRSATNSSTSSVSPKDNVEQATNPFKSVQQYRKTVEKSVLSNISERSELDESHSVHSRTTHQLTFNPQIICTCKFKKADSDSDLRKKTHKCVVRDKNLASKSILHAVGDNLLFRKTIEQFSNKKNIFEQQDFNDILQDTITNDSVIENTPPVEIRIDPKKIGIAITRKCTVVSKSTTDDESNTEAIIETPTYVNNRIDKCGPFSRFNAKVNDTNFDEKEVIECVNNMVDNVCADLVYNLISCEESSNEKSRTLDIENVIQVNETYPTITNNKDKSKNKTTKTSRKKTKPKGKKATKSVVQQQNEISETNVLDNNVKNTVTPKNNNKIFFTDKNSSTKKKRKLYSPNDDYITKENVESTTESDNIILSKLKSNQARNITNNSTTPYKDIENKKILRKSRSLKSRGTFVKSPSPNTKESDAIFDRLVSTVENDAELVVANPKCADDVYNFNSSSEDSDFQIKRNEIKKRLNSKKVTKPAQNTKSRNKKIDKPSKDKTIKKKRTPAKKESKTNLHIDPVVELVDERMRNADAVELLNSSIEFQKECAEEPKRDARLIIKNPQMELIPVEQDPPLKETNKNRELKENSKSSSKKRNTKLENDSITSESLPGLITEVEQNSTNRNKTDFNVSQVKRRVQEMCQNSETNISIDDSEMNLQEKGDDILVEQMIDDESIKTVSSTGIQAHIYSDESPPAEEMLDENISPRETVDMSDTIKKHYMALQEVCNEPEQIKSSVREKKSKSSPLVLSFALTSDSGKDYNKIPFKRSSVSDMLSSDCEPPKRKKVSEIHEEMLKQLNSSFGTMSSSSKNPTVILKRIGEEELQRWLSSGDERKKSKKPRMNKPTQSPKEYNFRKKRRYVVPDYEKHLKTNSSEGKVKITRIEVKNKPKYKREPSPDKNVVNRNAQRRSIISPTVIELNLLPGNADSDTNRSKERVQTRIVSNTSPDNTQSSCKRATLHLSSSEESPTLHIDKSVAEIQNTNKPGGGVYSENASSISQWLQQNNPAETDTWAAVKDVLGEVLEKLHINFEESNQQTKKQCLDFFLGIQNQLCEHKREMEKIYKIAMQRSDKKTHDFVEGLRNKLYEIIKQDRHQKQAMITILKDDVQAALDYIEQGCPNKPT